jgi:hypothetical protein
MDLSAEGIQASVAKEGLLAETHWFVPSQKSSIEVSEKKLRSFPLKQKYQMFHLGLDRFRFPKIPSKMRQVWWSVKTWVQVKFSSQWNRRLSAVNYHN